MSFRLFIYYCAAWGAAMALLGWALGQFLEGEGGLLEAALKGLWLGLFLTLGLGLADVMAGCGQRDGVTLTVFLFLTLLIGTLGGFLGGFLGQVMYAYVSGGKWRTFLVFGWTLTGLLIGMAPSVFDYLGAVMRKEDRRGVQRKLRNGLIGGTIGGLAGGLVSVLLNDLWSGVFQDAEAQTLWSPSATGFTVLGASIGLAIALTQVILREASLRVESGWRFGRQLLLTKPDTVIGRAESSDLGLFGDAGVEKIHARITRQGENWMLSDAGTTSGTLLNGQRVAGPTPLRNGDRIQVGGSVLSFSVRRKEHTPASAPVTAPAM